MPETERGYAPPIVRQFSVFLDNRVGKLLELLEVMETASDVHVRAICVLDSKWAPTDNKVAEVCQISSFGIRESYHMDPLSYSYTISLMILGGDYDTNNENTATNALWSWQNNETDMITNELVIVLIHTVVHIHIQV